MINILTSSSVPAATLSELNGWFIKEWGDVDLFTRPCPDFALPSPLVAVDEQKSLVGGLSFTRFAQPKSADVAVWINMVLVSPNHRQKGIASRLVMSAEVEAVQMGVSELYVLSAFPGLYQKLGWQAVGMNDAGDETILSKSL